MLGLTEPQQTRTTCPYCGVGCGVVVTRKADGQVSVSGDEQHPSNLGRLCSKGLALAETLDHESRLQQPMLHGRSVDWDTALSAAAQNIQQVIDRHGADAVALYVSGQMLTEDYYVANKFVKGYLGTANIDTNSRLCMSSAVVGHKRAFGGDIVPVCYEDLELADLVVITGSNLAWCHPVLYQRLAAAKKQRAQLRIVVIDPRGTATSDLADQHLRLQPGTDVALFNGLLKYLADNGLAASNGLGLQVDGIEDSLVGVQAYSIQVVSEICGLTADQVRCFYELFAAHDKTVSLFSQGVNQSSSGSDKVNSIINCHLLTGRIGRRGAGPFSITGQPNAMGGREVGGLSNMLAAHMSLDDADARARLQRFWDSPRIATRPGPKAVDLFEKVHTGEIKAIWIIATNPVVSLPDGNRVRAALEACDCVIVSDIRAGTDTSAYADILFPAEGWGEKDGTVTNSERRISRQRRFMAPPGQARPDWWIICELAKRMGFDGFDYAGSHAIFDEHARLSALENEGQRAFDIGGLSGMQKSDYDQLQPVQWPVRRGQAGDSARLISASAFTPNGRAVMIPVRYKKVAHSPSSQYPLILNTGRIRDQWHTMTRTGLSPRLSAHEPVPFAQVHPQDALLYGISDGGLLRLRSLWGSMVVRARFSLELERGQVFVPIHWNNQTASDACVGHLVNPAVDPISGEPEFKHTPVKLEPFLVDWHGFVLSRSSIATGHLAWWAKATAQHCQRYDIAGRQVPQNWSDWTGHLISLPASAERVEMFDASASIYRSAWLVDGQLEACVFVSPRLDLPSPEWLVNLFSKSELGLNERMALLAGRPLKATEDLGATVCSCFGVGKKTIEQAIRQHSLASVEAIGDRLRAGTNCGSCVPELKQILHAQKTELNEQLI